MKQINKNILWNSIGNTAYNGSQWLITVIVTRKAGFDEAGILALAMSVSLTFRTIAYFGIRNFQISDVKNKYSNDDYFGFRIITCAFSFLLCMLFSFASKYDNVSLYAVFFYMVFRISEGFSDLFQGFMQKNERLDTAGKCLFIKACMSTAGFFTGFYFANSLNAGLLLMSFAAVAETFIFEKKLCNKTVKIRFSNCKALALETVPLFIYFLETSVIFNIPKILIPYSFGKASLGAFSNIFSAALVIHALFQYIYIPFITEFSKLKYRKNTLGFKYLVLKIIFVFLFFLGLFAGIAYLFGAQTLAVIFGSEILKYRDIIIPTVFGVCTYSLMTFFAVIKTIERDFKTLIISHATGVTVYIFSVHFLFGYGLKSVPLSFFIACAATVLMIIFFPHAT